MTSDHDVRKNRQIEPGTKAALFYYYQSPIIRIHALRFGLLLTTAQTRFRIAFLGHLQRNTVPEIVS